MDAMAALALATEAPTPALLREAPHGRTEPLISRKMWKHIITQGLYQLFWLFLIIYGAPRVLPGRYGLPPPGAVYSAVETTGVKGLAPLLEGVTPGGPWSPAAPFPPAVGPSGDKIPDAARCMKGPCLNTCCTPAPGGAGCADNLAGVDGGLYLPGEVPLCYLKGGLDAKGRPTASVQHAKRNAASFCGPGGGTSCARATAFKDLDTQASKQFHAHTEAGRQKYNSIVFNAFIFMQLFNELNARKINDELNIFSRIWRSPVFFWVMGITILCQLVIMFTPVQHFFKVVNQSWQEWLFAVATGAGCMLWAILVKLVTRCVFFFPFSFPFFI
jgi:Ca2+-transporting ATPase